LQRISITDASHLCAVAVAFLVVAVLAGCGTHQTNAPAGLTPGSPLPARAGAHVWVVGLPDLVLGSADGGASWRVAHRGGFTNDSLGDLWAVAFGDAQHGWAVERGSENRPVMILATSDGDATWKWQYPGPPGRLLAVAASGARHAWAVGYRGGTALLLATSDGGTTWRQQAVPPHIALYDVAFNDASHGWALGADRDQTTFFVLSTVDGGAHWRVSYRTKTKVARLSRLASSGPHRCWVVGYTNVPPNQMPGFVVATRDGGAHWRIQTTVSTEALFDVAFPDARHGWAVGSSGTILATSDGGTTWVAQHSDRRETLKAVAFSDATHGWAMLGNVALLATTDGGKTWTVVRPTRAEYYLAAIACLGPSEGN
jgi:photosystem II stability/assembly factor-like uncharacterized protein